MEEAIVTQQMVLTMAVPALPHAITVSSHKYVHVKKKSEVTALFRHMYYICISLVLSPHCKNVVGLSKRQSVHIYIYWICIT